MADPFFSDWMSNPIKPGDRKYGLMYFSSIWDVQKWTPDKVDPLQRANVPLLKRQLPTQKITSPPQPMPLTNLLLCSDYQENHEYYLSYQTCQSITIPEEKYYVQFWQYVDVFAFFGHGRVLIPPPSFVNAGHRNGAQVIGELIFESTDLDTEAMLERDSKNNYWLADKLGQMAGCYGFDGWFINVEVKVSQKRGPWNGGQSMKDFLAQLKTALKKYGVAGEGKVVWYDSVTLQNELSYQGVLNDQNSVFAKASGSIFTDYKWKYLDDPESLIVDDANCANTLRMPIDQVYSGVNIHKFFENWSIEYMAKHGVGTGLFATGWCFQEFGANSATQDTKLFRSDADSYMWTGTPDLSLLTSAKLKFEKGDIGQYINSKIASQCITKFARKYPAGSEAFFHTDYSKAIAYLGPQNYRAHLGRQSIAPINRSADLSSRSGGHLTATLNDARIACTIGVALASGATPAATDSAEGIIILHELNMRSDVNYTLTVKYKRLALLPDLKVTAYVTGGSKPIEVDLAGAMGGLATIPPFPLSGPITAVGIHLSGPAKLFSSQSIDVMDIYEITIKPAQESYQACNIASAVFKTAGPTSAPFHRLDWAVPIADVNARPKYLPYSPLTGPFSHFNVSIGGSYPERAHTTSFVLDDATATGKSGMVDVVIEGIAFDGTLLDRYHQSVAWA